MLKARIDRDLKAALLAGDKTLATTLRGLKSAILYEEVAKGLRDKGLDDNSILELLSKEAKKRQESADLYIKGGNKEKAASELVEKAVIEEYLPAQLSDSELILAVDEAISQVGTPSISSMGQVIGVVKQRFGSQVDGHRVAQAVKERLSEK